MVVFALRRNKQEGRARTMHFKIKKKEYGVNDTVQIKRQQ